MTKWLLLTVLTTVPMQRRAFEFIIVMGHFLTAHIILFMKNFEQQFLAREIHKSISGKAHKKYDKVFPYAVYTFGEAKMHSL